MSDPASKLPEIASPCIGLCSLTDEGVCIGCFRTATEIAGWISYSPEKREAIMDALPERGQRHFDGV